MRGFRTYCLSAHACRRISCCPGCWHLQLLNCDFRDPINWKNATNATIEDLDKRIDSGGSNDSIHWINNPIPLEHLKYFIVKNIPKDLSQKEKLKWENKMESIVQSYDNYVNTVCNPKMWKEFNEHLKKWDSLPYNYSLHY